MRNTLYYLFNINLKLFKKFTKNISRKLKMKIIIFSQYLSIVLVKNKVLLLPHLFYLDTSVLQFLT